MKKSNLIPQYLQDELSKLVQMKDTYTKEEAAITNLVLMIKQFIIQETTKDAVRYLTEEKEKIENRLKELQQGN